MKRTLFLTLALAAITLAIYWPARHFPFMDYDDNAYLFDNPYIQTGFNRASLHDTFTRIRFANYAPVLSISYLLDATLFHLHPGPMHAENVLIHLINGLLVWWTLFRLTRDYWKSFAVAAFFLCHPTHVETACWIADRKDLMGTFFLLPAFVCYLRYSQSRDRPPAAQAVAPKTILLYLLTALLFILSLLSKSSSATFPAVLLLLDIWPLARWPKRSWTKLITEKIPLFLIAAVAVVVSHHALKVDGAVDCMALTLLQRIDNAVVCYAIYLAKSFVPYGLAIYYPHPIDRPLLDVFASAGLLIIIFSIAWRFRKKFPPLLVGWLWFVGCLLPLIQLEQIGPHAMADRYSYFPSIGLTIAIVWLMSAIIRGIFSKRAASTLMPCLLILPLTAYAIAAHRQVWYWKDTYTMFTHVLEVTPDSSLPHVQLGGLALDRNDLATAFKEYSHAADLSPDPGAFDGLGVCYLHVDFSRAIPNFRTAVAMMPRTPRYRTHLATGLRMHGDLDEAKSQVEEALRLNPELPEAHEEWAAIQSLLKQRKSKPTKK